MIKLCMVVLIALNGQIAHAAYDSCGKYQIFGSIVRMDKKIILKIHQNTTSEFKLDFKEEDWPTIVPYIDKEVNLKVKILKQLDGSVGEINSIDSIERYIPNALAFGLEDNFILLEKVECKKI